MIRYAKDQEFADFMWDVANDGGFWSIVHWKPFNKWYIRDTLGITHHELCKKTLGNGVKKTIEGFK